MRGPACASAGICRLSIITCLCCLWAWKAAAQPASTCSFPAPLEDVSLECSAGGKQWSAAEAAKYAVRHAPIIHMHPAEAFKLTDPRFYWKAAKVYGENYQQLDKNEIQASLSKASANANLGSATSLVRSFLTVLPSSLHEATAAPSAGGYLDVMAGSPVDSQGRSLARVFYQLLQLPGGAWVYTYNLYYTWNGCGNMVFTTTVGSAPHTLEYIACPDSIHESDWERVSVVVCPSDDQPAGTVIAALLSQHNHNQLLDCRPAAGQPPLSLTTAGQQAPLGQCMWELGDDGEAHLSVYSALHSHANYKSPSNATVFGIITTSEGDGVWLVDRTADGGPMFMPSISNVVPIPGSIPGLQTQADPDDWAWSQYPGWWGAAEWKVPGSSISCLSLNRTALASCPDSPAWRVLAGLLGIPASHRHPPATDALVMRPYVELPSPGSLMPYNYHAAGGAKQNPRYRVWAMQWDGAKVPPMYDLPVTNALFRVFLNNGKHSPTFKCFPPMQPLRTAQHARAALLRLGPLAMHPLHPIMLLLTIPLTLTTAWVLLHIPRLATLPSASSTRPGALSGQVSQLATTLLSGASGTWQAVLPGWAKRGSSTMGTVFAPPGPSVMLHSPEVELGVTGEHATPGVSHRSLNGANSVRSRGSGGGVHGSAQGPSRCTPRLLVGLVQQVVQLGRMCCAWLNFWAMLASIAGGVMYSIGLTKANAVLNGTLGVGAPLYNSLCVVLQAAVVVLLVDHLVLLCCLDCLLARARRRPAPGPPDSDDTFDTRLRQVSDAGNGGDDDDEFGAEDIRLLGQGSSPPRKAMGLGAALDMCLTRWSLACGSGNTHRCMNAALTSGANFLGAALTAAAVLLVAVQAGVQHACQTLVFGPAPHAIPSVITMRTDTTAYAGELQDVDDISAGRHTEQQLAERALAAVFSPVGAIKPTQGPGKVYASALCIHWRDDYGAALLVVGSVTWCVLHMWLRAAMLHAVHER